MANKLDLVPLNDWGFFHLPPRPCVIAGPCSAESEEQIIETAEGLRSFNKDNIAQNLKDKLF